MRRLYFLKTSKIEKSGSLLKRIIKYILRTVLTVFGRNDYVQRMAKNSQKYIDQQTRRVGNFTAFTRMACDKRVFKSFIDVEFEGRLYKAPVGFDEWLRSFYGEYMQLPPEEKRVSHHSFVAYADVDEKN